MTCTHVLGLIDAGPFAGYPRAHLDAAWRHARRCATCGPALEAATALTTALTALARPAPPPDLAGAVLARIARIEDANAAAAAAATVESQAPSIARGWPALATALGGLAAIVAIVLSMPSGGEVLMEIASPRAGGIALVAMPGTADGTVVLAAGLVLYAAGLFASIGAASWRRDRSA